MRTQFPGQIKYRDATRDARIALSYIPIGSPGCHIKSADSVLRTRYYVTAKVGLQINVNKGKILE